MMPFGLPLNVFEIEPFNPFPSSLQYSLLKSDANLKQLEKFHLAISLCGVILNLTSLFCHFSLILLLVLAIAILLQSGVVLSIIYFSDILSVVFPQSSFACPLII